MVRSSIRLACAGDQVRCAFRIRAPDAARTSRLEWHPRRLSSSRRRNNERALLPHWLADGQRPLADILLLLGHVFADSKSLGTCFYSWRRAAMGSMRLARRAGIQQPRAADKTSAPVATSRLIGSVGVTFTSWHHALLHSEAGASASPNRFKKSARAIPNSTSCWSENAGGDVSGR